MADLCARVTFEQRDLSGALFQTSMPAAALSISGSGASACLQIQPLKGTRQAMSLKGVAVYTKFLTQGKATVQNASAGIQVLISDADADELRRFLQLLAAAITGRGRTPFAVGGPVEQAVDADKENRNGLRAFVAKRRQSSASLESRGSGSTLTASSGSNGSKRVAVSARSTVDDFELGEDQRRALELVAAGQNVFITGSAGTGKSLLLSHVLSILPTAGTFVTASTGVAACNIGGVSLHSFAGVVDASLPVEELIRKVLSGPAAKRWREAQSLVIDEVSMIDGRLFDKLDGVARAVRNIDRPFGGIQMIASGDFLQLPPVAEAGASVPFCFESESWSQTFRHTVVLRQVYRQSDAAFYRCLNHIRYGETGADVQEFLKQLSRNRLRTDDGIIPTVLVTHRSDVDSINSRRLEELPGPLVQLQAQDTGVEPYLSQLRRNCIARESVSLRVGAQVILLKNISPTDGFVNGARGVVVRFLASNVPVVRFTNGRERPIMPERWTIAVRGAVVAERRQVPLDLAWALSVHKCQGLTLDRVQLSLSKVFECGMAYVALSRARRPEDIELLDVDVTRIRADPRVCAFYAQSATGAHGQLYQDLMTTEMRLNVFRKDRAGLLSSFIDTIGRVERGINTIQRVAKLGKEEAGPTAGAAAMPQDDQRPKPIFFSTT